MERYKVNDNSFRMILGGKTLKVDIDVEDLGTFTGPWSENATFSKPNYNFDEYVCAQNDAPIGMDTKSGEMPRRNMCPVLRGPWLAAVFQALN